MPPAKRFAFALKGAILWVLLSCALGLIPLFAVPNHVTASIPWIAAAFGVIGATSHAVVTALKPSPLDLHTSAAAVSILCCCLFLAMTYWLFGISSQPVQELLLALLYVVAPAVGLSYSVLLLQRRHGAA